MEAGPLFWLDGEPTASLPLPDRGLAFGDGVFETLLIERGSPLFLSLHLARLERGLAALGFAAVPRVEAHIHDAAASARSRDWPWAALRVTVTRGAGPRGYAPPVDTTVRVLVELNRLSHDAAEQQAPARLGIATTRVGRQPALAGLKHLNRLEQVLAAREAQQAGMDDMVMLDTREKVVGAVAGNLFLRRGDRLQTPVLDQAGIAGTRRRLILEHWASACSLAVEEASLTFADLASADEVFVSNSLVTVRPVAELSGQAFSDHSAARALFKRFCQERR